MSIPPTPFPTPTHGRPTAGSFTVASWGRIGASPETALRVVLDAGRWGEWNRFVPAVTIDDDTDTELLLRLGTRFTEHVNMDFGTAGAPVTDRPTELVVSVLGEVGGGDEGEEGAGVDGVFDRLVPAAGDVRETGTARRRRWHRVAWAMRASWAMPAWLLRCERVQEFRLVEGEGEGAVACDYVSWETFYGPLAPVLRMAVGGKVVAGFAAWTEDLKRRAEELEGGRAC